MGKRVFTMLCLGLFLLLVTPVITYAKDIEAKQYGFILIEPLWAIVEETDAHLRISNGRATMSGTVIGQPGTTSITANAVLERANLDGTFSAIATFNNMHVTGRFWEWERTYHVARGHVYRLTITATVIRNGISETVTVRHTARAD